MSLIFGGIVADGYFYEQGPLSCSLQVTGAQETDYVAFGGINAQVGCSDLGSTLTSQGQSWTEASPAAPSGRVLCRADFASSVASVALYNQGSSQQIGERVCQAIQELHPG